MGKEWNLKAVLEINGRKYEVKGRVYKGRVWYYIDNVRKLKLSVPEEKEEYWWRGLSEFKRFVEVMEDGEVYV